MPERLKYKCCCVSFEGLVVDLVAMIDANREITRGTFVRHVDRESLRWVEVSLGYGRYFRMSSDWHVSYHRSKLEGKTVYYFRHSSIEYIFA